jgi:predicted dehydrogenase
MPASKAPSRRPTTDVSGERIAAKVAQSGLRFMVNYSNRCITHIQAKNAVAGGQLGEILQLCSKNDTINVPTDAVGRRQQPAWFLASHDIDFFAGASASRRPRRTPPDSAVC